MEGIAADDGTLSPVQRLPGPRRVPVRYCTRASCCGTAGSPKGHATARTPVARDERNIGRARLNAVRGGGATADAQEAREGLRVRRADSGPTPQAASVDRAALLAGGTELLNWFRLGITAPDRVVDIGGLDELRGIEQQASELRIGALATLNEIGEHPLVVGRAGALASACLQAASAQLRNRATIGGNVLQRTRCAYFRAEEPVPWPCNKRAPGSGCAALAGRHERHAIFGWTEDCVAVRSRYGVALAAPAPRSTSSVRRPGQHHDARVTLTRTRQAIRRRDRLDPTS